eukprot:IDg12136t1
MPYQQLRYTGECATVVQTASNLPAASIDGQSHCTCAFAPECAGDIHAANDQARLSSSMSLVWGRLQDARKRHVGRLPRTQKATLYRYLLS